MISKKLFDLTSKPLTYLNYLKPSFYSTTQTHSASQNLKFNAAENQQKKTENNDE